MSSIEKLAHEFRAAIEVAIQESALSRDIVFQSFPNGCCGDTCDLLAQYFLEHGIKTKRVLGSLRSKSNFGKQTHAWLQYGNTVIIDITGDQFKDNPTLLHNSNPVYVGKKKAFHRLFGIDDIDTFTGISALDIGSQRRLTKLYEIIMQFIDNKE